MDQLDDEANDAHDEETHGNGLGDLEELYCSQNEKRISQYHVFSRKRALKIVDTPLELLENK